MTCFPVAGFPLGPDGVARTCGGGSEVGAEYFARGAISTPWKEPWAARGSLVHGFGLDIDDAFVEGCVEHVVELVVAPITTNGGFHPSSGEEGEWTHEHPRSR
jgi:hypothetical protein